MAQGTSRLGSPEERELFAHSSRQGSGLTLIGRRGLCAQPEQLCGGGEGEYCSLIGQAGVTCPPLELGREVEPTPSKSHGLKDGAVWLPVLCVYIHVL